MCDKCDEIADSVTRYRLLRDRITDEQMRETADRLIEELEAKRLALHPRRKIAKPAHSDVI